MLLCTYKVPCKKPKPAISHAEWTELFSLLPHLCSSGKITPGLTHSFILAPAAPSFLHYIHSIVTAFEGLSWIKIKEIRIYVCTKFVWHKVYLWDMKGRRGETLAINEMESLLRLELTCIGSPQFGKPSPIKWTSTLRPIRKIPINIYHSSITYQVVCKPTAEGQFSGKIARPRI